jgi:hypothetical protein
MFAYPIFIIEISIFYRYNQLFESEHKKTKKYAYSLNLKQNSINNMTF